MGRGGLGRETFLNWVKQNEETFGGTRDGRTFFLFILFLIRAVGRGVFGCEKKRKKKRSKRARGNCGHIILLSFTEKEVRAWPTKQRAS